MKIARVKTEKWHNNSEGDVGSPINRLVNTYVILKKVSGNDLIERNFYVIFQN